MSARTFDKLLQKRALWSLIYLEEDTHDMVRLFPTIESLLEILTTLVDEDFDRAWISNMSVCFKFLADTMTDVGRCYWDGIQGDNFGCLGTFWCELEACTKIWRRLTARTQAL